MRVTFFVFTVCLALLGCTTVPMGDPIRDTTLKEFRAPIDRTGVYIYRNESFGGAIRMDILVNGSEIGSTAAKTYLYTELTPGKYTITSKSENSDSIEIDAKPNTVMFIWQEVKMGFMYARTKLHLATKEAGEIGVKESKLAVR